MLRNRILTALALVPLVVASILLMPTNYFMSVIGFLLLIGSKEMAHLAKLKSPVSLSIYMASLVVLALVILLMLPEKWLAMLQLFMFMAWVAATIILLVWRSPIDAKQNIRPSILLAGGLVLIVSWLSVTSIHQSTNGPWLVLFLFFLIWSADTFAYFAGKAWGLTKLSPIVSPGKTWAGALGANVGALVCTSVLWWSGILSLPLWGLVVLSLVVTWVSIGGDLWESLLKRQAGVKDSGTLLPGHGGVLDRVDSLLAAAPVFVVSLDLLGAVA